MLFFWLTLCGFGLYLLSNPGSPIKSANEDIITSLPGLAEKIKFKQYSGYLQANKPNEPNEFMHYWLVESQSDPVNDPVLLWLNGGPGCSSMGGLFTELGPFKIHSDGKTLTMNRYSWNKRANVLFLDSPIGVGFSYSSSKKRELQNDDKTAQKNYLSIKSFFEKFPQFSRNQFYISGESYAGVYLPTLGVLLDVDESINFQGVAIGNGYLDVSKLTKSLFLFAYNHGLFGKDVWELVSRSCCNNTFPSRETCDMSDLEYDKCHSAIQVFEEIVVREGVNPYNIYADCSGPYNNDIDENPKLSRDMVGKALIRAASDAKKSLSDGEGYIFNAWSLSQELGDTPCVDESYLAKYLNTPEVQAAIHVASAKIEWELCSDIDYKIQYPQRPGGLAPQINQLIQSKRNLTMLVYNGDVDAVCNFLGGEWFVDDLGREVVQDYQEWKIHKQVAGWYKAYDKIAFVTVRGSGHMVPGDKPEASLYMIETFLSQKHEWFRNKS